VYFLTLKYNKAYSGLKKPNQSILLIVHGADSHFILEDITKLRPIVYGDSKF